jgi:hypothetical protein
MIKASTRNLFKPNTHFDNKYVKSFFIPVVNTLLRNFSICNSYNHILGVLEKSDYIELSKLVSAPNLIVKGIVERFLKNIIFFEKFLKSCEFKSRHSSEKRYRYIRLYLHKVYRIAPVFNYERAKQNLQILHDHLDLKFFWPQFTTQIAIVIFVTDKKDTKNTYSKNLMQKNIRAMCSCSAYAFHRTLNILHIKL